MEHELARIALGQDGVVKRSQVIDAGVSVAEIRRRVRRGTLIPEYRGVYRVGHRAQSVEARYLAAVLACGERAVLSGLAAAYLLRLLKSSPPPPEVSAPTERRIAGVQTRRVREIDRRETTRFHRIPVTTVARTLVDLAARLPLDGLARACHEAGVLHRTTPAQVGAVLARRPNTRGAGRLLRVLRGDVHVTLSKLERGFLQLLRDAGLPLPETNRAAGGDASTAAGRSTP